MDEFGSGDVPTDIDDSVLPDDLLNDWVDSCNESLDNADEQAAYDLPKMSGIGEPDLIEIDDIDSSENLADSGIGESNLIETDDINIDAETPADSNENLLDEDPYEDLIFDVDNGDINAETPADSNEDLFDEDLYEGLEFADYDEDGNDINADNNGDLPPNPFADTDDNKEIPPNPFEDPSNDDLFIDTELFNNDDLFEDLEFLASNDSGNDIDEESPDVPHINGVEDGEISPEVFDAVKNPVGETINNPEGDLNPSGPTRRDIRDFRKRRDIIPTPDGPMYRTNDIPNEVEEQRSKLKDPDAKVSGIGEPELIEWESVIGEPDLIENDDTNTESEIPPGFKQDLSLDPTGELVFADYGDDNGINAEPSDASRISGIGDPERVTIDNNGNPNFDDCSLDGFRDLINRSSAEASDENSIPGYTREELDEMFDMPDDYFNVQDESGETFDGPSDEFDDIDPFSLIDEFEAEQRKSENEAFMKEIEDRYKGKPWPEEPEKKGFFGRIADRFRRK